MSRTTENKKKLRARSYGEAQARKEQRLIQHKKDVQRGREERKANEAYGAGSFTNRQIEQRAKYYERIIKEHGEGHFKNAEQVHRTISLARNRRIIEGTDDE